MKFMELVKKVVKNKTGRIACLAVALVIVLTGIFLVVNNFRPKVDTYSMLMCLTESSELTTAKLTFRGLAEYEDAGIAILNRQDYKMLYKATARIGIDVKEIEIDKEPVGKNIIVRIPKAKVLDVKIHTEDDSMKIFDEKFALFNLDIREDHNEAIALAAKSAEEEISEMGGLKMADDQAAALIKGILANVTPKGYQIVVKQK